MIKRYLNYYFDYWPIVIPFLIIFAIAWGLITIKTTEKTILNLNLQDYENQVLKTDSLQNVVDSLQAELKFQADGFDSRESRYEDVIGEYEIGLSYLKDYHPTAYKDFHRIIGMREKYSRELDRENKQRLNQYKTK